MASFNKVIVAGNFTRDPELKTLPSGNSTLRFTLAVNRKGKSKDGKALEETTYVPVDAFGKIAETIAQYCHKGSPLLVEGRLHMQTWEDRHTGAKKQQLTVILEQFQFLGGSKNNIDF